MNKSAQFIFFSIAITIYSSSPALSARIPKTTASTLGGFSLTPTIGIISTSGPGSRSTSPFYGIKFGYDQFGSSFVNSLGVEGNLNYYNNGNSSGYLGNLDILYLFQATKTAVPYIVVGAGAINSGNNASSDTFPFINYGLGLKYFLKDTLALRGDVRHILAYESRNGSVHDDFNIFFGISYYFGKPGPAKSADKTKQQQIEKEKLEKEKIERELKEKEKIEQEELKKQQEEKEKKRKLEQQEWDKQQKEHLHKEWKEFEQKGNGTGLPGKKPAEPDKINHTEVGPIHVIPGLAAMSQASSLQTAPGQTASGMKELVQTALAHVAPAQTASAQRIPDQATSDPKAPVQISPSTEPEQLRKPGMIINIQYQTGKADVLPKYYAEIAMVARYMKDNPHTKGIIEGHTDNQAGKLYNQKLSELRANNVKMYLIKHFSINASRLQTKGYGYSKPIADNSTPEGRQKNRRVIGNFDCVEIHCR